MRCKHCKTKFEPKRFLQKFCLSNDECLSAFVAYSKEVTAKAKDKQWRKEKEVLKVETHSKENKNELQKQINLLARMIDAKFHTTCICCHRELEPKQVDGAHFGSIGGNHSLRYNLDNIHAATKYCNHHSSAHLTGYKTGLEQRYGKVYANYVIDELRVKYNEIKLSNQDISDKLKLVRSIVRNFETYKFENSLQARRQLNELIGIYK